MKHVTTWIKYHIFNMYFTPISGRASSILHTSSHCALVRLVNWNLTASSFSFLLHKKKEMKKKHADV